MREILFRGKRTADNEWVYGDLLQIPTKNIFSIMGQKPVATNCRVKKESIGQYTGLTDCNGKKIFEGDILQNKPREFFSKQYRFVVTYDIAAFYGKGNYVELCYEDFTECEIIGNIYDNPEFVESEADIEWIDMVMRIL